MIEGRANIIAALSGSLARLDTSHSLNNPLVNVEGDIARLDALVEAQHVPVRDPGRYYLMKNRYDVELARLDDRWVITRNTVDDIWRDGDVSVMSVV